MSIYQFSYLSENKIREACHTRAIQTLLVSLLSFPLPFESSRFRVCHVLELMSMVWTSPALDQLIGPLVKVRVFTL